MMIEASRAYIENMPEPRMAYITNRRLFENARNSSVRSFQRENAKISAETKPKTSTYMVKLA